ncbi:MAG: putative Ig domain-containing protein, partial [Nitrospirae bacterium]|nr:putative Ig domain-containing protein [Nitrospirota bacterium]
RYFEIRMEAKGLFINPPTLHDATVDTPYNERLSAVGGLPIWSLEGGDLPTGMPLNSYTGEIAGTPTVAGSYTFTVRGDDPISGYSSSKEYTININSIPNINDISLPEGIAGRDYSGQITVTGGSRPLMWSIKGNLPEGLALDTGTGIISGALIVSGIYDFTATIKDANGATDSRGFRITVIEPEDKMPPDAIRDLRSIYITDTSMLLLWSAPLDDSMTRTAALYDLRYVECNDSSRCICPFDEEGWDLAIEANGEPRPQAGTLHTYTLTGLKLGKSYCVAIKSMDAKGHVSTISNIIVTSPSDMGVSGFTGHTASLTLRWGYNLVAFPMIPVPNGRDSLFGPLLGTPVALYRWYSAYPGITPPQYYLEENIMPGLGYLLYSPEDDVSLRIDGLGIDDSSYKIAVQNGWNMIGTPYDKSILLHDVQVKNGSTGEIKLFVDAVKAGWIGNTIYNLESGNYDFASFNDDPPAVLEPWVGYWIYVGAESGVEVIFRRP